MLEPSPAQFLKQLINTTKKQKQSYQSKEELTNPTRCCIIIVCFINLTKVKRIKVTCFSDHIFTALISLFRYQISLFYFLRSSLKCILVQPENN